MDITGEVWLEVHVDEMQRITPLKFIKPFDGDSFDATVAFFETREHDMLYVLIYHPDNGFDQWACCRPDLD